MGRLSLASQNLPGPEATLLSDTIGERESENPKLVAS